MLRETIDCKKFCPSKFIPALWHEKGLEAPEATYGEAVDDVINQGCEGAVIRKKYYVLGKHVMICPNMYECGGSPSPISDNTLVLIRDIARNSIVE